jgi:hypothetical protein
MQEKEIPNLNINPFNANPRFRTSFFNNEFISFEEDETIEYKCYNLPLKINYKNGVSSGDDQHTQKLVDNLKKQICGLLNNKGGRVYIGINDDRKVEGVFLNPKQRDETRNTLINFTSDFYPKCRTDKIKISMIPVKNAVGEYINNKYVVKILVKKGDTGKLYSVSSKFYKSYMRLPGQCVELSSIEIEKEIIDRNLKKEEISISLDDFIDPEPEINLSVNLNQHLELEQKLISEKNNLAFNNVQNKFLPHGRKRLGSRKSQGHGEVVQKRSQSSDSAMLNSEKLKSSQINKNSQIINLIEGPEPVEIELPLEDKKSSQANFSQSYLPIKKEFKNSNIDNIDNNIKKSEKLDHFNNISEESRSFIHKKQLLEKKTNPFLTYSQSDKENDKNLQKEKPVYVLLSNLPENATSEQIFNLLNDLKIQFDTTFKMILTVNKALRTSSVKFRLFHSQELKNLKEKLTDFIFMGKKLQITSSQIE